ncbi:MAG TPA: hypothetical protein VNQ90_17775 [Chthoniobacteraceae bacterium]|nr:hypothetical protein [Chthoniobacteraceae bacterium]
MKNQKRKRKKAVPKIRVKDAFPYSFSRIVRELRISPGAVDRLAEDFPADYTTRNTRRYRCIPEGADRFRIIKKSGRFHIVGIFSRDAEPTLFEGTKEDCEKVLKATVTRWWSLSRGREFPTVAQEILGLKELQK